MTEVKFPTNMTKRWFGILTKLNSRGKKMHYFHIAEYVH